MVCYYKFKSLQKCSVKNVLCIVIFVCSCTLLHLWLIRDIAMFVDGINTVVKKAGQQREAISQWNKKQILLWGRGMKYIKHMFSKGNCSISQCIITENRGQLGGDYSRFDAIVFNQNHLGNIKSLPRSNPENRTGSQIYIFTSVESSSNHPACELYNDDFFNWTFTFRLDSDVVWNFFVVRNISGDIVAPSETVGWNISKYPVNNKIKSIFQGRTRAAAWLVSNCKADSLRNDYLTSLQEHLYHHGLSIDVYGKCTNRICDNNDCEAMLRNKYYFYMAFENSFADDYVTEKVLHGYDNYVVPIVYGGANYTRFLPPGSYINAQEFHPYNLANIMHLAISNVKVYETFFHWTNFYTIDSDRNVYNPVCELCKALNSERAEYAPAKKMFRLWWNTLNGMKWCLAMEYWNETSKINFDGTHIYKNTY